MDEITLSQTLKIVQGGQTGQITASRNVTMIGNNQDFHTENYTTTAAKVVVSAATKAEGAGWFSLLNPSTTDILLISMDNNVTYTGKCLPGEMYGPIRLNVVPTVDPNIFVKCNSAVGPETGAVAGARVGFTGR